VIAHGQHADDVAGGLIEDLSGHQVLAATLGDVLAEEAFGAALVDAKAEDLAAELGMDGYGRRRGGAGIIRLSDDNSGEHQAAKHCQDECRKRFALVLANSSE